MVKRGDWLSLTPEPERELPQAVATLTRGRAVTPSDVAAERARIEQLVLRGSQASWLAYLHRVVELIELREAVEDPDVARAREIAVAVISNHHNLLLGLPGGSAERTATDRAWLSGKEGLKT